MHSPRRLCSPRWIAALTFTTVCAASVTPAIAGAQEIRPFQNSWFWGAHIGTSNIATGVSSGQVATLGGEWLITRSRGGLYAAYDQSSFHRTGQIADASATNGERAVSLHDMRTISLGGVAFPTEFGNFRPYGGAGFSISIIGDATPQPEIGGSPSDISADVRQRTDDARTHAAIFFLGGGQWQMGRTAFFGQISLIPSSNSFLITSPVTTLSIGARYNFGSSISK